MKFFRIFSVVSIGLLIVGILMFALGLGLSINGNEANENPGIGYSIGSSSLIMLVFSVPMCICCGIITSIKDRALNKEFLKLFKRFKGEIYKKFKSISISPIPNRYGKSNILDTEGFIVHITTKWIDKQKQSEEDLNVSFEKNLLLYDYDNLVKRFDKFYDINNIKRNVSHFLYNYLLENAKGLLMDFEGRIISEELFREQHFFIKMIDFMLETTTYNIRFGFMSFYCRISESDEGFTLLKEALTLGDDDNLCWYMRDTN